MKKLSPLNQIQLQPIEYYTYLTDKNNIIPFYIKTITNPYKTRSKENPSQSAETQSINKIKTTTHLKFSVLVVELLIKSLHLPTSCFIKKNKSESLKWNPNQQIQSVAKMAFWETLNFKIQMKTIITYELIWLPREIWERRNCKEQVFAIPKAAKRVEILVWERLSNSNRRNLKGNENIINLESLYEPNLPGISFNLWNCKAKTREVEFENRKEKRWRNWIKFFFFFFF